MKSGKLALVALSDDRIEIEGVLGRGRGSVVYRAFDHDKREWLTVKIAHKPVASGRVLEGFEHPHILPVYHHERAEKRALEKTHRPLIEGTNLEKLLANLKPLGVRERERLTGRELLSFIGHSAAMLESEEENVFEALTFPQAIAVLGYQLADALAAAHGEGYIHQNLKPTNVPGSGLVNMWEEPIDEPPQEVGQKSKNEWWYVYWGLGWGTVSYPEKEKPLIESLRSSPGVSHLTFLLDVLGIYFPRKNFQTMLGGNVSLAVDRFSDRTGSAQTSQYMLSASGVHFFGKNIGDGFFMRGDLGFAIENRQVDGTGLGVGSSGYYLGFGMLAAGGYAIPISNGTRLLGTLLYAVRVLPTGNWGTFGVTLGLLF